MGSAGKSRQTSEAVFERETLADGATQFRSARCRVHILTGSRFVSVTMQVSKELSRTGEMIRLHAQQASFSQAFTRAEGGAVRVRTGGRPAGAPE